MSESSNDYLLVSNIGAKILLRETGSVVLNVIGPPTSNTIYTFFIPLSVEILVIKVNLVKKFQVIFR